MANIKWATPTSVATLLDTSLDDLAIAGEAESADYVNTNNDLYADFELVVCYATAPAAGVKAAELYLLPKLDGTNLPSVTSSGLPQKALLIGALESVLPSTTVAERLVLLGVSIPPGTFRIRLSNTSGQAYKNNTVAKTLKIRPYQLQSA